MTENTRHGPYVTVVDEFDISTIERTVTVRKLETRKGERLEIESPSEEAALRVDALGLESLAWQEPDVFSRFLPDSYAMHRLDEASDEVTCDTEFELMNEYAYVRIRRLCSLDSTVLQIRAPKKREQIQIDANGLVGLSRQDHTIFSEFLEEPHGPEDHH